MTLDNAMVSWQRQQKHKQQRRGQYIGHHQIITVHFRCPWPTGKKRGFESVSCPTDVTRGMTVPSTCPPAELKKLTNWAKLNDTVPMALSCSSGNSLRRGSMSFTCIFPVLSTQWVLAITL